MFDKNKKIGPHIEKIVSYKICKPEIIEGASFQGGSQEAHDKSERFSKRKIVHKVINSA
jgi:hypothetical protein